MSIALQVEEGKSYEGYDSLAALEWCSPSFLKCQLCVSAGASQGTVTISLTAKTPFGNVSKSFSFSANRSFTWQPFSRFKITVSVSNLNEQGGTISFDLGLQPCVNIPVVGWKCFDYSHHFSVPTILHGIETELDNNQFSSLLALNANQSECKDCGDKTGTGLLQGDIYSNYLNNQAGSFPTLPVVSCVVCLTNIPAVCNTQLAAQGDSQQTVFPTVNATCFPTMPIGCFPYTHLPPHCNAQLTAGNAKPFPTLPVVSCVVCLTNIPAVCNTQLAAQGDSQQTVFPTVHTTCFPTTPIGCFPHTHMPPHCNAQLTAGNAKPFPTLPVVSCVVCVTNIPAVCSAQSAAQNAFPTAPATICPTLPTTGCTHTAPATICFPTFASHQCITAQPDASFTGFPPLCASQQAKSFPTVTCTGMPPFC